MVVILILKFKFLTKTTRDGMIYGFLIEISIELEYILGAKFCKMAIFWDPRDPWGYF